MLLKDATLGLASETPTPTFNDFSRHPSTDKFWTIDGLLKSHARDGDQKPLICYPKDGVADFEEHTAEAIDRYADRACQFYIENGLQPADPALESAPVVAILAPSSFDVVVSMFALNRLGWAILFLSTRLTAPAYARLLGMADCNTVIIPHQRRGIIDEIRKKRPECQGVSILQRCDYRGASLANRYQRNGVNLEKEGKKLAWILHSSGSTGFPKPIYLTNMQCLSNFRKSFGMRAFCTSPLFHSHGLMELFRAFYTRATMYLGNHAFPITSQNLLQAITAAKPELIAAVPYVLKLLAESTEGVQALARTKIVLFGGSSCPDELGDVLVANGVNLVANYGATETGQIMTSFRPPGDTEWQYMRLHRPVADHTLMDEIAPGVFECVGLDGLPSKGPSNSVPPYSKSNPENSFRTADLFTRHPDPKKPNYYKYLSRLDDRITLVNGEKVLPIPIEGRIRQEQLVREAVVFGFERTVPGLLVFRSNERGLHLTDDEYLTDIWPAIEAANANAETFSRIPRELVIVIGPDVPYPRTDKGTFIRAQVYLQFADSISQAYQKFNNARPKKGLRLSVEELEKWLMSLFRDDLHVPLPSISSDIFSFGVDSLQTMRVWRAITSTLDLGETSGSLSQNIVFEKGTVEALALHLYRLRMGFETTEADEVDLMHQMIDEYSHFTTHTPTNSPHPDKAVVLVTGGTGNLGAHIVAELLERPAVAEVWALVRAPDSDSARARILHALSSRQLQVNDGKLCKLHAVASDLSSTDLGLDSFVVSHLLDTLTCVVHSAWAVNFNLGIRSFEEQHIKGTYNLLNFCLRSRLPSPARFFFCSSVSVASGTPKPAIVQETLVRDFSHVQKTGYARSKLVTEHIVSNAMKTSPIHARVLRIGQLGGSSTTGIWNDTEAVALMIRSAVTIGALPALDDNPSWLPVDVCAQAVIHFALRQTRADENSSCELVYHLVNPRTFSWKMDLLPTLSEKSALPAFETVSPREWIERLQRGEQDPVKNPSIKLLDFWKAKYGQDTATTSLRDVESSGLTFDTSRTVEECPLLAQIKDPVSEGLIQKYVEVWMKDWIT